MKKNITSILCAVICLSLGTASGLLTMKAMGSWYPSLHKPPGTPPPWLFGPVWSVLYILMGIALGRLIHKRAWVAVKLFALQFALNLAWTPVFFVAHQTLYALALILSLWILILITLITAYKADRPALLLLAPYLLWVSYATYLNAGIVLLN